MAKTWVLDTDTKGTGAEMVPLERLLARKRSRPVATRRSVVRPKHAGEATAEAAAEPRRPLRFRIVDVVSRRVLAEDAPARDALRALAGVRSVVDVRVYVDDDEDGAWRPLTLRETKLLWRHRGELQVE